MAPKVWGNMAGVAKAPAEIGRRQFFQQLANAEIITKDEAVAAMAGVVPQGIENILALIPDEQIVFDARMMFIGAVTFSRNHPYVELFAAMYGMSIAELDLLWLSASKLY